MARARKGEWARNRARASDQSVTLSSLPHFPDAQFSGAIAWACDERQKLLPSSSVFTGMNTQPKSNGQQRKGRTGDNGRIVTVGLPLPYEGVGNALRATYRPGRDGVPSDMLDLLSKLDRH